MDTNLLDQTRSHYDSFPFIEGGANRIAWWREYLRAFLPDRQIQDRLVLDVGSSVGEISRGMIDRGARLICLDLSFESLRRCRRVNPEAELLHASALDLPFPNNTFDHSIAIGVLHHTPDCRRGFREMARVVAPGGTILVFLYNAWSIYLVVSWVTSTCPSAGRRTPEVGPGIPPGPVDRESGFPPPTFESDHAIRMPGTIATFHR